MNNIKFVESTLHTVASGIDISEDFLATQNRPLSSLIESLDEKEEKSSQ